MALQGDEAPTIDLYETAISTLTELKDIQTVWLWWVDSRGIWKVKTKKKSGLSG
jgi:hypothetical protein